MKSYVCDPVPICDSLEIDFVIPHRRLHLLPAVGGCAGFFLDLLSGLWSFPGKACSTFGSSLKRPGVVFLHDFLHLSYLALNFTLEAKFEKPHVINKLMKWLFQPTYLWGFYLHLLPRTWPVTARPHTPIHAVSSFTSFSSPSLTCVIQK